MVLFILSLSKCHPLYLPYHFPHVRYVRPISVPLIHPPFYPIAQHYTIIGDLIGAPENVENELLEAYKDPDIDVEMDKLADALDKDGNNKISYSEWNQVRSGPTLQQSIKT